MAVAALKALAAATLIACALVLVSYTTTSTFACRTTQLCDRAKVMRLHFGRKLTLLESKTRKTTHTLVDR